MKNNSNEMTEALFIIDMNNGFCENGALADPAIKHIVPAISKLAREVLKNNQALFIVNDKHTGNSVELKRYPAHCHTAYETKTIKELRIYEEYATKVFYKNSTCALFAPYMIDTLMAMTSLEKVVITGCCSDICIQNFAIALRNFFDELNLDIEIVVPLNTMETYDNKTNHDRIKSNILAINNMRANGINMPLTLTLKKEGNK